MSPFPVDAYDAAIILGARIGADGSPSPAMRRRVAHGVDMLGQGRTKALLMSGGATSGPVPEAVVMRELALAAGVPPEAVHLEDRALNTIENARFSVQVARREGWRRLAVVTDSFHVPRAWYIFRRFGVIAAMEAVRPDTPTRDWWLAHGREAVALPWTILRMEVRSLIRRGSRE